MNNRSGNNKTRKILLIVSGALTLIICAVMNLWLIPAIAKEAAGEAIFDMRFAYPTAAGRAFLAALTDAGRQLYLTRQLPLDFVYPAVYTVFFLSAFRALRGRADAFFCLPCLLAAADVTENICTIVMLRAAPSDALLRFASCATTVKSVLMYLIFVLLAVLLIRYLLRRKKRPEAGEK